MKRILYIIFFVLLIGALLIGCTEKEKNNETAKLPTLSEQNGDSRQSEQTEPQLPIDTEEQLPPETVIATEETLPELPTETVGENGFGGLDVEEDYTVVVSENQGIGGGD